MSILSRIAGATSVGKINTDRLPTGGFNNLVTVSGQAQPSGQVAQLSSMQAVSVLFAVVNRIAQSVAASEWKLYRKDGGELTEIDDHPAIDLWHSVNEFTTREDFLESSQQHMELVGEMWWVLVRNFAGVPVELQLVRPDRMKPIPHPTEFIQGYEYKIGNSVFQLDKEDVIFTRNPSPMDAYRGIGVVQSMMVDLGAERLAAEWMHNFFRNSAEPGGIIEFPNNLQDADFQRLAERWRFQHQGVANAHRVAILERGTWKDRKLTQRDMQFEELRRFERDQILGAFGMPLPIMGITESVNRANAEAAEVMYTRWLIRPRLMRIRAALNEKLLKLYPDGENLCFEFHDPVPENRAELINEGSVGYEKGIITLNEARARFGEDMFDGDGGDDLKQPPPAPVMQPPTPPEPEEPETPEIEEEEEDEERSGGLYSVQKVEANESYSQEANNAANRIERGWKRRFKQESDSLIAYFNMIEEKSIGVQVKLAPSDVDGYDWDWWDKYGDEVVEELAESFMMVLAAEAPQLTLPELQRRASLFAENQGAALLKVDGDMNMVTQTRSSVNQLVSKTIKEGESLGTLSKRLEKLPQFSTERARTVARTETATALGQGQKEAARAQGRSEKRWVTQGDALVAIECLRNEAQGWIPINDKFTGGAATHGGKDTIPEHINCRCVVQYRDSPLEADEENKGFIAEVRCPVCDRKNGENVALGTTIRCRRCKWEWRLE